MPNKICRPPKPAARSELPQAAGANKATAPMPMKQIPITGTTFTEAAPPHSTPVPPRGRGEAQREFAAGSGQGRHPPLVRLGGGGSPTQIDHASTASPSQA